MPFGTKVKHPKFGTGEIVRTSGTTVHVQWRADGSISRVPKDGLEVVKLAKSEVKITTEGHAFKRRFADVIDEMLARKEWTWDDLRRETGLSRRTIYRFLSLDPNKSSGNIDTLERIASALGIAPSDFWEREHAKALPR